MQFHFYADRKHEVPFLCGQETCSSISMRTGNMQCISVSHCCPKNVSLKYKASTKGCHQACGWDVALGIQWKTVQQFHLVVTE